MSQQQPMSQELQRKLAIVQLASQILDGQMKERDIVRVSQADNKVIEPIPKDQAEAIVEGCFVLAEAFDKKADVFVQPSRVESENPKKSSPLIGL